MIAPAAIDTAAHAAFGRAHYSAITGITTVFDRQHSYLSGTATTDLSGEVEVLVCRGTASSSTGPHRVQFELTFDQNQKSSVGIHTLQG